MTEIIKIYTDGVCSGNPGYAGAGAVIIHPNGKEYKAFTYLGNNLTNNIAELKAIQFAVKLAIHLKNKMEMGIEIYSDNVYLINILTDKWQTKKNIALVYSIKKLLSEFKNTRFIKIKTHSIVYNDIAYKLALDAITYQNSKKIKEYVIFNNLLNLGPHDISTEVKA